MSFDIYVSAFRGREVFEYDAAVVEDIFRPLIARQEKRLWTLRTGGFVDIADTPQIEGFSVNRPSSDRVFWDAVLEVLRRTPSVLY
ncbi:MAG TPA: hypothetical protein VMU56_08960 [Beijerinckiaceae bacterium]|nr:hypothetical protein [Beijerinckiaceae bacterium]